VFIIHQTGDLHIVLPSCALQGPHAQAGHFTLVRNNSGALRQVRVRLPVTCSSAVHGSQLVMMRAAAPNLLQVRAGRHFHLRIALLLDTKHSLVRRSAYFLQQHRAFQTHSRAVLFLWAVWKRHVTCNKDCKGSIAINSCPSMQAHVSSTDGRSLPVMSSYCIVTIDYVHGIFCCDFALCFVWCPQRYMCQAATSTQARCLQLP
jgi:hypothetical protein